MTLFSVLLFLSVIITHRIVASGAQFLGQDVSSLATGFAVSYPTIIIHEYLKIFFLVFLPILGLFLMAKTISMYPYKIIGIFSFGYGLQAIALSIYFPSLFEGFLGSYSKDIIYSLAMHINPHFVNRTGIVICSITLIILQILSFRYIYQSRSKKLLTRLALGSFVILFHIGAFHNQISRFVLTTKATHSIKHNISNKGHILLIAVDSLRKDHTTSETYMPFTEGLSRNEDWYIFGDHHIGVPRTFPSWLELLQGRYAPETGIRHMFPEMPKRRYEYPSLEKTLFEKNYKTVVVSDFAGDIFPRFKNKFQVIDTPKTDIPTLIRMNIVFSLPLFIPAIYNFFPESLFSYLAQNPNYTDPNRLTNRALSHLQNEERSQFILLFYSTAHFPYAAPWPYYTTFTDKKYHGPFRFQKNPELTEKTITDADKKQITALYSGATYSIDQQIKNLIGNLKLNNIYDETLIIITADHGEELFEYSDFHGHGEHLWGDRVTNVPLYIKPPKAQLTHTKEIFEKNHINSITRSIDLYPTIVGLTDNFEGERYHGYNLFSQDYTTAVKRGELYAYMESGIWSSPTAHKFLSGQRIDYPIISSLLTLDPGESHDIILNPNYEAIVNTAKHRAIIADDYKLIYIPTNKGVQFKLYNRRIDPLNRVDLSLREPKILDKMVKKFYVLATNLEKDYHLYQGYFVKND